jgi:ferritin-like protein
VEILRDEIEHEDDLQSLLGDLGVMKEKTLKEE